ncbi:hypothetical protein PSE_p0293 (plasmid) [Pseudovibrio sp. FO-BEG1]|nr:hypothetical protein PSE_p0293 [Pseudovibrio sp. FO-BEG1]
MKPLCLRLHLLFLVPFKLGTGQELHKAISRQMTRKWRQFLVFLLAALGTVTEGCSTNYWRAALTGRNCIPAITGYKKPQRSGYSGSADWQSPEGQQEQ